MAKKVNNESANAVKNTKKTAKSTTTKNTAKSATSKRTAAAKKAGIDVDQFFSISQQNGGRVTIVNGKVVVVGADGQVIGTKAKTTTKTKKTIKTTTTTVTEIVPDDIEQAIIGQGHIENAHIHRRWVMAQTFRMLRRSRGWLVSLRDMGYDYMWRMLIDECHVIARMERNHSDQLAARKRWFTLEVIMQCLADLKTQVNGSGLSSRFKSDVVAKINEAAACTTYADMERALQGVRNKVFCRRYKNFTMPMCFINAYKGNGAYYTMQNMIMFHGCFVHENGHVLDQYASLDALERKAVEVCRNGEGYKLFGIMKQLITDNNFDFYARMREQYANR